MHALLWRLGSTWCAAAIVVTTALGQTPPTQPATDAAAYRRVTRDRLRQPADGDWLMIRRTYDGWGYSPLTAITADNVARLKPVWTIETGEGNGHEAAPLVNNGVMFVSTPGNQVIALDAATGRVRWRYKRALPDGVVLMHPTSRGVALYDDKVFLAANEAVLVALDAATGKEIWTRTVEANSNGYYMTMAPLVADGKVMVSASGGEYRRARLCRGVRCGDRQRTLAHVLGARARRAWQRDVAERRSVEERRRSDVGHGQLRSRDQSRLLGHGQRRALDGRSASRRQPVYGVDTRD